MSAENIYFVKGMTCGHCVTAVTSELTGLTGVHEVRVELETGQVTVISDNPLPVGEVRDAVDEAGYELVSAA